MELNNAKILLTGGSSGIGKATAQLLVEQGAQVLITGRDENKLQKVAQQLGCSYLCADAGVETDIERTFQHIQQTWGSLDVLINNAGIGKTYPIEDLTFKAFDDIFRVNVYGAAIHAQKATALFKQQGFGNIVNIASTAAKKSYPGGSVYSASKFALRSMTQAWQSELRKFNIRVIQVNPSEVPTAFGSEERIERPDAPNKLTGFEIGHAIVSALKMDNRGFIPELSVWATNPF